MKRFLLLILVLCSILPVRARADTIKWVDFDVPYESLNYAMEQDISTFEEEDSNDK